MKNVKKHLSLYLVSLFLNCTALNAQEKILFSDTLFEFGDLKVEFEKTYAKLNRLKSIVAINNLSDHYLILNAHDIIANDHQNIRVSANSEKVIIIPPKDVKKISLSFDIKINSTTPFVEIEIMKLTLTDKVSVVYDLGEIPARWGSQIKMGDVYLKVIEVKPRENDCLVRTRVDYAGTNMLFNASHMVRLSYMGEKRANTKKNWIYLDKDLPTQEMILLFPGTYNEGRLDSESLEFRNVFKEYTLSTIAGFKIKLKGLGGEFQEQNSKNDKIIEEIE